MTVSTSSSYVPQALTWGLVGVGGPAGLGPAASWSRVRSGSLGIVTRSVAGCTCRLRKGLFL